MQKMNQEEGHVQDNKEEGKHVKKKRKTDAKNLVQSLIPALHDSGDKQEVKTTKDFLTFIHEELQQALAVTIFIHVAKYEKKIPIYVPAVEQRIQKFAATVADEMKLETESLQKFFDVYCKVSKEIQTYWKEKGDNFKYDFSIEEIKALEEIKKQIPTLSEVKSLADIRAALKAAPDLVDKLLGWGREVISKTNLLIINAIKIAAENNALTDVNKIRQEFDKMIDDTFTRKNIISKELLQSWVESLCQCKLTMMTLQKTF